MIKKILISTMLLLILPKVSISMHNYDEAAVSLHAVCEVGDCVQAQELIDAGADIDEQNFPDGWTPLHTAVCHGHKSLVELLLTNHASTEIQDSRGHTPLHTAVMSDEYEIAEILLNHAACIEAQNNRGFTPLHEAACDGNMSMVELLLKRNACVHAQAKNKQTPLHCAAAAGHDQTLQSLVTKSFVVPESARERNQPKLLKHLCFATIFRNFNKKTGDDLKKTIDGLKVLEPWRFALIAEHVPFEQQRSMYAALKSQNDQEGPLYRQALLAAHCQRHLAYIQQVLTLKNKQQQTARTMAQKRKRAAGLRLLDGITQAPSFDGLEQGLQKDTIENITNRLTIS